MVAPQPIDRMGLFRGSAPIRPSSVRYLVGFRPEAGEKRGRDQFWVTIRPIISGQIGCRTAAPRVRHCPRDTP
jgi:hypothetical protein